ncbi:MAG: molybdenum cofactor guanylyltransferase [Candidatus Bathyarchaeia archaeon]
MRVSLVILAGGASRRLGEDKAFVEVAGQPMIGRVIARASPIADEVIVTVNTREKADALRRVVGQQASIVLDSFTNGGPLAGAATGLQEARGELAVLLADDLPLVSLGVLKALVELCSPAVEAVVPRWPNGFIEPLHAVYRTTPCFAAARKAVEEGGHRMASMLARLRHVVWEPTERLRRFDPLLLTFLNVNTRQDLERIKQLI